MTDSEFAAFLRSVPREKPEEQVIENEKRHDRVQGPYVPHHHHPYYEESRH